MLEFLFGFGFGIMIGTKYNCKPYIDLILYTVKNTLQDIKKDFKCEKIIINEKINEEIKKEN